MAMTPEGKVKAAIKDVLKKHGAYWYMPVTNGMGAPALDFFVCHRGRFMAIEAKRPGVYEMTSRQDDTAKEVREAGGAAFMVNGPEDVEQLDRWLDYLDKLTQTGVIMDHPEPRLTHGRT